MELEDVKRYSLKMKIDIIVPIYNAARYIPSFFSDLAKQTFSNFRVIFSNDASTDDSLQTISDALKVNPEIQAIVITAKENGGAGLARDLVLDTVPLTGDYVAFMDADDHPHPDFLQKLVNRALETNADIVACGFTRVDEATGKAVAHDMLHNPEKTITNIPTNFVIPYLNTAVWNKLFRRSLIQNARFGNARSAEDAIFFMRFLCNAKSISFINESLYDYLIHPNSRTANTDIDLLGSTENAIKDAINENSIASEMKELTTAIVFLRVGIGMTTRAALRNKKDKHRIIASTKKYLDANYPLWRKNTFTSFSQCFKHGLPPSFCRRPSSSRMVISSLSDGSQAHRR